FAQQYSRTSGHGDVVKGRIRKTPRPTAYFVRKQQTMRVLINGELKQIKSYKTKLWGVEQKSARDLTYRFVDGQWRSGDDHVVERIVETPKHVFNTTAAPSCGISGAEAEEYGRGRAEPNSTKETTESAPLDDERAKNA
ncbi:hypothetical protein OXX59_009312, partial [Metschnikowia pulcherrima]